MMNVSDTISLASTRDVCVVLPSMEHAIYEWPSYIKVARSKHRHKGCLTTTRTAIVFRCTRTVLRLWVPFVQSLGLPLDKPRERRKFELVSPYFSRKELERWKG